MSVPLFTTPRLVVRQLVPDDAAFYMELLNDADFKRHIADRGVHTLDLAREHLEARVFASYDAHGFGMWCVARQEDGLPIGIAGLVKRDFLDDVDLGYAFLPEGRGAGYATEAALGVMRYATEKYELARLAAIVSLDNDASIQVLQRLGFHRLGEVRFPDGGDRCHHFLIQLPASI
ncbi:MAG: GNAT family N-acetyltransferase [Pseudomonadota bacterium]